MANAYSREAKFTRPQIDTEFQIQVANALQQKYDTNAIRIQQAIDQVANLDIAKDVDKQYLYERVNGIVDVLNKTKGKKLQHLNVAQGLSRHVKQAIDDNVMNAVVSTQMYRAQDAYIKKLRDKDPESYHANNEAYAKQNWESYLKSEKVGEVYKPLTYTPYYDYNKNAIEKIAKVAKDFGAEVYYEGDGSKALIRSIYKKERLSPEKVKQIQEAALGERGIAQMQIDAWANYGRGVDPDTNQKVVQAYKDRNKSYAENYNSIATKLKQQANTLSGEEKKILLQNAEQYEQTAQSFLERNKQEVGFDKAATMLYKDDWLSGMAQAFSYDKVVDMKIDKSNLDIAKYQLDVKYKENMLKFKQAELVLKQQSNEIAKEANRIASADDGLVTRQKPTDSDNVDGLDFENVYKESTQFEIEFVDTISNEDAAKILGIEDATKVTEQDKIEALQKIKEKGNVYEYQNLESISEFVSNNKLTNYLQNKNIVDDIYSKEKKFKEELLDDALLAYINADGGNTGDLAKSKGYVDANGNIVQGNVINVLRNQGVTKETLNNVDPNVLKSAYIHMYQELAKNATNPQERQVYEVLAQKNMKEFSKVRGKEKEVVDLFNGVSNSKFDDTIRINTAGGLQIPVIGARTLLNKVRSIFKTNEDLSDLASNDWKLEVPTADGSGVQSLSGSDFVKRAGAYFSNSIKKANEISSKELENRTVSVMPNSKQFGDGAVAMANTYLPTDKLMSNKPITYEVSKDFSTFRIHATVEEGSGKDKVSKIKTTESIPISELPPSVRNVISTNSSVHIYDATTNPNAPVLRTTPSYFVTDKDRGDRINELMNGENPPLRAQAEVMLPPSLEQTIRAFKLNPSKHPQLVKTITDELRGVKFTAIPKLNAGYLPQLRVGKTVLPSDYDFVQDGTDLAMNYQQYADLAVHNYMKQRIEEYIYDLQTQETEQ